MTPDKAALMVEAERGLRIELVMQDGSIAVSHIADTVHNRQLQNFIARHESFALVQARAGEAS